jgi:hypothetical protein
MQSGLRILAAKAVSGIFEHQCMYGEAAPPGAPPERHPVAFHPPPAAMARPGFCYLNGTGAPAKITKSNLAPDRYPQRRGVGLPGWDTTWSTAFGFFRALTWTPNLNFASFFP